MGRSLTGCQPVRSVQLIEIMHQFGAKVVFAQEFPLIKFCHFFRNAKKPAVETGKHRP